MDQANPDTVQDLSDRIVDLCGRMHGAVFQLLELIRQLDLLKPWSGSMPSCAHWLVWRCGMDIVTAREKVRVAHALAELPRVCEKFRSGELSYSKVRAITRIVEPATENEWVETALAHTAAELERIVRQHRQTAHLSAPDAAMQAWKHRHFDYHVESDGSLVFEGRLPAEVGAMLRQAMDRAMEWLDERARPEHDSAESRPASDCRGSGLVRESAMEQPAGGSRTSPLPRGAGADFFANDSDSLSAEAGAEARALDDSAESSVSRSSEDRPSATARRADALGVLAERFLAVAPEGDDNLQTADRFLLTVHASAQSLASRAGVDPSDPPSVEHGPVLATETVRRIGCDAALVRILESGDGEPLDVGRKTRVIPPAIRRALKRRDGGCRFPGCTHTKFVDGHHIVHWADGGATSLENLVTVCRHHHRLLHEGGYSVAKHGAEFLFFRGDGVQVPKINDSLQPATLAASFGEHVSLGELSETGMAWRVAGSRGWGRRQLRAASLFSKPKRNRIGIRCITEGT